MATDNGSKESILNPNPVATTEPTDSELLEIIEGIIKDKGLREKGLKLTAKEALEQNYFRKTAAVIWKSRNQQEISSTMELIVSSVKQQINEIEKKISQISVNPKFIPSTEDPKQEDVRSELERIISSLNLRVTFEDVTRLDAHHLTKKLIVRKRELSARESALDGQILLAAMQEEIPVRDLVPERKQKEETPLWMRVIPKKEEKEEAGTDNYFAEKLKQVRATPPGSELPDWLFNPDDKRATTHLISGFRGYMISRVLDAKSKGNEEIRQKAQELVNMASTTFGRLIGPGNPGNDPFRCPSQLYGNMVSKFETYFREFISEKPAPTAKQTPKQENTDRQKLVEEVARKLVSAGFKEFETEALAGKIMKKYGGNIKSAAIAKREQLEESGLSEEEKLSLQGQLQMYTEAAGSTSEEIEQEFKARKQEREMRIEEERARKEAQLSAQVARPLTQKQALMARSKKSDKKKDKKSKKDAGISRHRK